MDRDLSRKGFSVHVCVFNNDFYEECYGVVPYIKEPEVCYRSKPHVGIAVAPKSSSDAIKLRRLNNQEFKLILYSENNEKLYEINGELKYLKNPLLAEASIASKALPFKIPEAKKAKLIIGSLREDIVLPPQVRVYGRVTDFHGRPRRAYVRIVTPYGFPIGGADTKTDGDGYYEMYAPEAIYDHAFICDGGYGRETLEFYGWRVPIKLPRFKLDARFDKIEIYRLSAMTTPERTLMVHFVAWDIVYTSEILKTIYEDRKEVRIEDLCTIEILTPLRKRDIEVYLGKHKLPITSMHKINYSIKHFGVNCMSKGYLVEAKIPGNIPGGEYPVRVVAHTIINDIGEWGEAVLYGVRVI